ncbi:MAG: hypothetical protein HZB67_05415 [Candidatus Aenigmarchaeota archaeon]|nr:hypothetical protein [Candidatus Aenigmarchaeota archaeon]
MARKRFSRQNYFRFRKLGVKWRKPRGKQSKTRIGFKGKPVKPNIGYKKPDDIRGTLDGKRYFRVSNISDVEKMQGRNMSAVLSSSVGLRKALEISKRCDELGIVILNKRKVRKALKVSEMKKKRKEAAKIAKEKKVAEKKEHIGEKKEHTPEKKHAHAKETKEHTQEKKNKEHLHGKEMKNEEDDKNNAQRT